MSSVRMITFPLSLCTFYQGILYGYRYLRQVHVVEVGFSRRNSKMELNTRQISNFALSSNQGNACPQRKKCNFGVECSVGADVPQNLVARSSQEYNDCGLRNSAGS